MATEKEVIILDFQVEQGSAISELEKTKKSIIQLKQEQKELNDAYKKGNVTIEEYASESVRLEGILKKQQSTYNNVQKSVTGVKTKMDDLISSNNKLANSVKESTSNISVAGVSVGDLTTKIASFANPATAAVGIVTALGAAYARSTIGAKDLEFAQNQLSFATTYLTDNFANLISSSEDGEGLFSKITSAILFKIDYTTAILSKVAAMAQEELGQVQRDKELAQVAINDRLSENAELLTEIGNAETDITKKKEYAQKIEDNITQNTNERLELVNREIDATRNLIIDRGEKEFRINKLLSERSNIQRQETKQKEKIEKQLNSIVNAETKRLKQEREKEQIEKNRADFKSKEEEDAKRRAERERGIGMRGLGPGKLGKQELKFVKQTEEQKREEYQKSFELKRQLDEEQLAATALYFDAAATLAATAFGEGSALFKALAVGQTIINTYSAAAAALAPPPTGAGPLLGPALAAVTIASGLANVARITGVAAAGGADFVTNRPTMLLVGDNPGGRERVTVEPLSGKGKTRVFNGGVAMAGGGSLTVDGGAAKNSAVRETNNALLYANAIKNMPKPVVGWAEGKRVRDRVEFKEKVTRL